MNMKIKLFTAAIMVMLLLSCQGPMGPQGPQGPPGELNWKVYDFNVPSSAWELVGDADGLNSYYVYVLRAIKPLGSWHKYWNTMAM